MRLSKEVMVRLALSYLVLYCSLSLCPSTKVLWAENNNNHYCCSHPMVPFGADAAPSLHEHEQWKQKQYKTFYAGRDALPEGLKVHLPALLKEKSSSDTSSSSSTNTGSSSGGFFSLNLAEVKNCREYIVQGFLEVKHPSSETSSLVLKPDFVVGNQSVMEMSQISPQVYTNMEKKLQQPQKGGGKVVGGPYVTQPLPEPEGFSRIIFRLSIYAQEDFPSSAGSSLPLSDSATPDGGSSPSATPKTLNTFVAIHLHNVPRSSTSSSSGSSSSSSLNLKLIFEIKAQVVPNVLDLTPLTTTEDGLPVKVQVGTLWEASVNFNTERSKRELKIESVVAHSNLNLMIPDGQDTVSQKAGFHWTIPAGVSNHFLGKVTFGSSHRATRIIGFVVISTDIGRFFLLVNLDVVPRPPRSLSLGIITSDTSSSSSSAAPLPITTPITIHNEDPTYPMQIRDIYVVQQKSIAGAGQKSRCFSVKYHANSKLENNRQEAYMHRMDPIKPLTAQRVASLMVDTEECRLAYGVNLFSRPISLNATLVVRTNGTASSAFPKRIVFTVGGTWLLDLLRTPVFEPLKKQKGGMKMGGGARKDSSTVGTRDDDALSPISGGAATLHRHLQDEAAGGFSGGGGMMMKWGKGISDSFGELLIPCHHLLKASDLRVESISSTAPWLIKSGLETSHRFKRIPTTNADDKKNNNKGEEKEGGGNNVVEAFSLGLWTYNRSALPTATNIFFGGHSFGKTLLAPVSVANIDVQLSFVNEATSQKERAVAEVSVPVLLTATPVFVTFMRTSPRQQHQQQRQTKGGARTEAYNELVASRNGGHPSDSQWSEELKAAPFIHQKQRAAFSDRAHRCYFAHLGLIPPGDGGIGAAGGYIHTEDLEVRNPYNVSVSLSNFVIGKGGGSGRDAQGSEASPSGGTGLVEINLLGNPSSSSSSSNHGGGSILVETRSLLEYTSTATSVVTIPAGESIKIRVKIPSDFPGHELEGNYFTVLKYNATIQFPSRTVRQDGILPIGFTYSGGSAFLRLASSSLAPSPSTTTASTNQVSRLKERFHFSNFTITSNMETGIKLTDGYVTSNRSPRKFTFHTSILRPFTVERFWREIPPSAQEVLVAEVKFDTHFAHNCRRDLMLLHHFSADDQKQIKEICREEEDAAPPFAMEGFRRLSTVSSSSSTGSGSSSPSAVVIPWDEILAFGDLPGKLERPKSRFNVLIGPKTQLHADFSHRNLIPTFGPQEVNFGAFPPSQQGPSSSSENAAVATKIIKITNPSPIHPLQVQLLNYDEAMLESFGYLHRSDEAREILRSTHSHFRGVFPQGISSSSSMMGGGAVRNGAAASSSTTSAAASPFKLLANASIPVRIEPNGSVEIPLLFRFSSQDWRRAANAKELTRFKGALLLRNNETGFEIIDLVATCDPSAPQRTLSEFSEKYSGSSDGGSAASSGSSRTGQEEFETIQKDDQRMTIDLAKLLDEEEDDSNGFNFSANAPAWPSLPAVLWATHEALFVDTPWSDLEVRPDGQLHVVALQQNGKKSNLISQSLRLTNNFGGETLKLHGPPSIDGIPCGSLSRLQVAIEPCSLLPAPGPDAGSEGKAEGKEGGGELILSAGETTHLQVHFRPQLVAKMLKARPSSSSCDDEKKTAIPRRSIRVQGRVGEKKPVVFVYPIELGSSTMLDAKVTQALSSFPLMKNTFKPLSSCLWYYNLLFAGLLLAALPVAILLLQLFGETRRAALRADASTAEKSKQSKKNTSTTSVAEEDHVTVAEGEPEQNGSGAKSFTSRVAPRTTVPSMPGLAEKLAQQQAAANAAKKQALAKKGETSIKTTGKKSKNGSKADPGPSSVKEALMKGNEEEGESSSSSKPSKQQQQLPSKKPSSTSPTTGTDPTELSQQRTEAEEEQSSRSTTSSSPQRGDSATATPINDNSSNNSTGRQTPAGLNSSTRSLSMSSVGSRMTAEERLEQLLQSIRDELAVIEEVELSATRRSVEREESKAFTKIAGAFKRATDNLRYQDHHHRKSPSLSTSGRMSFSQSISGVELPAASGAASGGGVSSASDSVSNQTNSGSTATTPAGGKTAAHTPIAPMAIDDDDYATPIAGGASPPAGNMPPAASTTAATALNRSSSGRQLPTTASPSTTKSSSKKSNKSSVEKGVWERNIALKQVPQVGGNVGGGKNTNISQQPPPPEYAAVATNTTSFRSSGGRRGSSSGGLAAEPPTMHHAPLGGGGVDDGGNSVLQALAAIAPNAQVGKAPSSSQFTSHQTIVAHQPLPPGVEEAAPFYPTGSQRQLQPPSQQSTAVSADEERVFGGAGSTAPLPHSSTFTAAAASPPPAPSTTDDDLDLDKLLGDLRAGDPEDQNGGRSTAEPSSSVSAATLPPSFLSDMTTSGVGGGGNSAAAGAATAASIEGLLHEAGRGGSDQQQASTTEDTTTTSSGWTVQAVPDENPSPSLTQQQQQTQHGGSSFFIWDPKSSS